MNALSRPTASNAASAPAADTASDAARFHLPLTAGPGLRLARAFLALGVAALIGSGVLAIVLVLSRTPGIAAVFPLRDLFRAALVVHVDLSVLIWFMAFAGLLWSVAAGHRGLALGWAGWALSRKRSTGWAKTWSAICRKKGPSMYGSAASSDTPLGSW